MQAPLDWAEAQNNLGFTLRTLEDPALARSRAIIDDMRGQNCARLWAEIGMSDGDVVEPVWGAGKATTLGELVCGMAEGGVEISEFKGAGFFSKDASLKLTLPWAGCRRSRCTRLR